MPNTYMKIELGDFFKDEERRVLIDGFDALLDVIRDSPEIPAEKIVSDILHTLRTGEI